MAAIVEKTMGWLPAGGNAVTSVVSISAAADYDGEDRISALPDDLLHSIVSRKEKGVSGYAVNRWGIKRPPNGTKFDGRLAGDIPRSLGKSRPIPRTFFSHSRNKV